MRQREARRLALLIIATDIDMSLDVSDEWARHPETDAKLDPDDCVKVKEQARRFLAQLERRIAGF